MNPTKLFSTLLAILITSSLTMAQSNVIGLKWNKQSITKVDLVNFNPTNGDVSNVVKKLQLDPTSFYVNNTLHHDEQNDLVYFQTQSNTNNNMLIGQKLLTFKASTGEMLRSTTLPSSMAPFIISEKGEFGFIGTEKESNGYGNNDDDISFVVFNMNTGKTKVKVDLPNLSFSPINAPFIGQVPSNLGSKSLKNISLSTTCYLSKSNEVVFSATDVMGIQRLFRVNISTGVLVSSNSIDASIIDMINDPTTGLIQTLYLSKDLYGNMKLMVGTLNPATNTFNHVVELRSVSNSELPLKDGSIEISDNKVFVNKLNPAGKQELYVMNAANHESIEMTISTNGAEQYDFAFPHVGQASSVITLKNLISVFPNPAVDMITVESLDKAIATYVTIRNDIGQVIQEVKIENGARTNNIDVSALASGIYMVEVQTDLSTPVNSKLIIQ